MIVLAIETSCDETGVGIARLDADGTVTLLADEVASSVDEHTRYGGWCRDRLPRPPRIAGPDHAPRAGHRRRRGARRRRGHHRSRPGRCVAGRRGRRQGLRRRLGRPFYAVNHLGGHLAADVYDHGPLPESVGLLVSGGHTHLLYVRSLGEPIEELGSTVDDAAGEAYDKVARLLGLGYPGGKALDDLARTGDRDAIAFPRGMTGPRDHRFAFSFSGVKTAVARYVEVIPTRRPPTSPPDSRRRWPMC